MTCGTPVSTSSTAGTSRCSPTQTGIRCGSARSNQVRPTTSPPPAPTPLPALYPAAAAGLPTLTDKGYAGAGIGIKVPIKGHALCPDNQARNTLINSLRAPAERANALLKSTWRALRRITLDPWRIGAITSAALVLLHLQKLAR